MKRKRGTGGWLSWLGGAIFGREMLPALGGGYHLEIAGSARGVRAVIGGGLRILLATDTEVALLGRGVRLRFLGEALVCLTYEGGIAEIEGRLATLSVEDVK